jgi:hypothetical protein
MFPEMSNAWDHDVDQDAGILGHNWSWFVTKGHISEDLYWFHAVDVESSMHWVPVTLLMLENEQAV